MEESMSYTKTSFSSLSQVYEEGVYLMFNKRTSMPAARRYCILREWVQCDSRET